MLDYRSRLAGLVLLAGLAGAAAAQNPNPAPRKYTAEQLEKLKARARLGQAAAEAEKAGRLQEALALRERVHKLTREVYGPNDPEVARSLQVIGDLNLNLGDWPAARTARKGALDLLAAAHGPADWRTVDANLDLRDVDLFERMTPEDRKTAATALALMNDGIRFQAQLRFKDAQQAFARALETNQQVFGEHHMRTALGLNRLAGAYQDNGEHATAQSLNMKALKLGRELTGIKHPLYAATLNSLGLSHLYTGQYAKAEPLLRQSLSIRLEIFGAGHKDYATSLNNLALYYSETGDLEKAVVLYARTAEIKRKAFGDQDDRYISSLSNLANTYEKARQHAKAQPLLTHVADYRRKRFGETHPEYAISLNNLGTSYLQSGDYAKARPALEKAAELIQASHGEGHSTYALVLANLATLYRRVGDYDRAEPLLKQALDVRQKTIGETHPLYAHSLSSLGSLYLDMGQPARAEPLFRASVSVRLDLLARTADAQPEVAQIKFAQTALGEFMAYQRAAAESGEHPPAEAYALALRWKGQVFVRQRRRRELARAAQDPRTKALAAELLATTSRLAALAGQTPAPETAAAWRTQVQELSATRERLERELTRLSAGFRQHKERETLTPEQLRALLPAGTALVDFLIYERFTPDTKARGGGTWETRLMAFVVRPERDVVRVDLGPYDPVREAIEAWRKDTGRKRPVRDDDDPAALLRDRLWLPLTRHLGGAATVLVSPDQDLAKLPFGALPGSKDGLYLIEELAVAVLPVPQFLPDLLSPLPAADPSLMLVGEVDYGADPGRPAAGAAAGVAVRGERGGGAWKPLPATREEVAAIKGSFEAAFPGRPARTMRAGDPTEEAVRSAVGRHRFVHLATHGFFSPPEVNGAGAGRPGGDPALRPPAGHLPGLLSGVVLAGANKPADVVAGGDDGILTAAEVVALDLRGVEMVVLSACETGLGPTAGGEGVLGLQRAFQVAGARTVVASLWEVPDDATRVLMTRAYENWWGGKRSKLDGLVEAQRRMLKEGTPDRAGKPARGRTPPLFWAAFVLSGDWR